MSRSECISTSPTIVAFPIPMRGNELDAGAQLLRAAFGFPIPMRGNELDAGAQLLRAAFGFPIPMRGNESISVR